MTVGWTSRSACAIALVAALSGCAAGDDTEAVPSYEVRDSAGIEIVTSHAPLLDSANALRFAPEPDVRIGVVSGEEPYMFADIRGLTRLADGRIVVLDGMSKQLRFFSPDGVHLTTSGGPGKGPGEFTSPGVLVRQAGDTVLVGDVLIRTRWAPDGSLVDQETVNWGTVKELGDFFILECPGRVPYYAGDNVIGCNASRNLGTGDENAGRTRALLRIPLTLDRADTIVWATSTPPFRYDIALGGSPPRVVYATTDIYSIQVRALDGTVTRIVRRADGNRPPAPERFNYVTFERAEMESVSLLWDLFVDDVNRIWGRIRAPDLEGDWYDVFDDAGRYLTRVEFPAGFTPFEIGLDYALGVSADSLGVEYVELYRLEGG